MTALWIGDQLMIILARYMKSFVVAVTILAGTCSPVLAQSLPRYNFAVTDASGNLLSGANVEVRKEIPGQPLAVLYSDRAGVVPLGNPYVPADPANPGFHSLGGEYQIRIYTGPSGSPTFERIWRYVPVGTAFSSVGPCTAGTFVVFLTTSTVPGCRTIVGSDLPNPSAITLGGVFSKVATATSVLSGIDNTGTPTLVSVNTNVTAVSIFCGTSTTYNICYSQDGALAVQIGASGDPKNYHRADSHQFLSRANAQQLNVETGFLKLGGGDAAAPVAQAIQTQSVVTGTANTAGQNLTIVGSTSTGTGTPGNIIFQTGFAATGSASTVNAAATVLALGPSQNLGSSAVTTFTLTHTLNTSGSPSVLSLDVIDTASGATTKLARIRGGSGGTTEFWSIDKNGAVTGTTASATALALGRLGATTPAFLVDASTASSITGVKVKSAAASGGVALSAIGETNVALNIDAAGSGAIVLNGTGTGNVQSARNVDLTGNSTPTVTFGTSGNVTGKLSAFGDNGVLDLFNGGGRMMIVRGAASAVNYINIQGGAASGGSPSISAVGTDTDIALPFSSQGAGIIGWYTAAFGALQVQFTHTASANRSLTLTGSNGGNPTISTSAGNVAVTPPLVGASYVQTTATTVGGLATCDAGSKGARHFVTDSNAVSYAAGIGAVVAAGGATNVPVVCDGTNWRIG